MRSYHSGAQTLSASLENRVDASDFLADSRATSNATSPDESDAAAAAAAGADDDEAPIPVAAAPVAPGTAAPSRLRRWSFTCFDNPDTPDDAAVENLKKVILFVEEGPIRFLVYQIERCPHTNKPHAQGYLELKTSMRMLAVKALFNKDLGFAHKAHLEGSHKVMLANVRYCTKASKRWPGTDSFTFGTPSKPPKSGMALAGGEDGDEDEKKPRAYDRCVELIHSGKRVREIERSDEYIDLRPTISRARKQLIATESEVFIRSMSISRRVYVEVIIGPPGVGKSHIANILWPNNHHETVFRYTRPMGQWFNGYNNHPVVIVDDFDDWISPSMVVQLMDKYQLQLPIKGDFVNSNYVDIRFISNIEVEDWWDYRKLTAQGLPCVCKKHHMDSIKSRICATRYVNGPDRRGANRAAPYPHNCEGVPPEVGVVMHPTPADVSAAAAADVPPDNFEPF